MRLEECCEIVSGATPSTSVAAYWNGDINWATPKDLGDLDGSVIATTPRRISKSGLDSCGATILPPGSVLFSSRAPIGHVAINTTPMATNQGFKSFVPRSELLHANYLYHWLRCHRSYLESLGNGATFKEVSKGVVARVQIPVPPLSEQRRIAAILDQADALRAKRRQTLTQLDEMARAIFIDMFGNPADNPYRHPIQQLSALIVEGDTINYGVIQPGEDLDDGIQLIRVGDLIGGRVHHDSLKRIAPSIEQSYKRSRLVGDEILVSCVGSIGIVALATQREKGFNVARAVARIRLSSACSRVFMAAQLSTADVQGYFLREQRTVSQPTLNIKQLSETRVICPPLNAQMEFEERVLALNTIAEHSTSSAHQLDGVFASLQHRAFRGEL
jgi:type I restriction enzyme S subunit